MHKEFSRGRVEVYIGWRTNFHIELGVGAWNADGFSVWIELLWLYAGIALYPKKEE